ncbi:MAG TPA: hypothetical protein PLD25_00935 [Chloroflexota bacterium]|nr:hypothetical protein [Chloroflexota bacterium]HUM68332.1 hypothetical protein [Chloroflexota bacterium]
MTTTPPTALPYDSGPDDSSIPKPLAAKETIPGGQTEVKWKVVAETAGITNATIVGGRLQSEGIPVRVWQESAGQAFGLTVGLLGMGYVAVPAEYETQALEILETDESDFVDDAD